MNEFDQAVRLLKRRKEAEALQAFDRLIETYPGEIDIVNRARMYRGACQAPPAESAERDDRTAAFCHALALVRSGDFRKAAAAFQSIVEQSDEDIDAQYNLACCSLKLGHNRKALKLLVTAVDVDPSLAETARDDPDLEPLHEMRRFRRLVGLPLD
jgi:TolA-binding protein